MAHLGGRKLRRGEVLNGFLLTEFHTFRVASTQITSEDFAFRGHKSRSERARKGTHMTLYAEFLSRFHGARFRVTVNGMGRAGIFAWRLLALKAGNRDVNPLEFPPHDPDPRSSRVAFSKVHQRANNLTCPATRTNLRVGHNHLCHSLTSVKHWHDPDFIFIH
jgi:hypothetical protein